MPDEPTTWIGVAILALVLIERFADRFMRWRESRTGNPAGTPVGNPGNPNGPKHINQRLDGFDKRLDTFEKEQGAEWTRQRKSDGEMHEKVNKVDRAIGVIEGRLKEMAKGKE